MTSDTLNGGISIVCAHIGSNGDHGTKCTVTTVYNTRKSALRSYDPYTSGSCKRFCLPSQAHPTTPLSESLCDMRQIYWWKRMHHDKPFKDIITEIGRQFPLV